MMIIDLSNYDIVHDMDQDLDTITDDTPDIIIPPLTKEKWVVILAAETDGVDANLLSDGHFDSNIIKRVKLHTDNDAWIVPLSTLVGPFSVYINKDYNSSGNGNQQIDNRTANILEPMKKWGDMFLPSYY